jgi:hypothetical protein
MTLVDERGRLFGKLNLIDAATLVIVIGLLPVGYAAYLLFRPSAPRIESVTQVPLSREEVRIADGAMIAAKLKVRGTGFNPLLRAFVGDVPALAFVFENPNSADVVVGDIPAGTHDLILLDGVHEVARAAGAVSIQRTAGPVVRVIGRFIGLDADKVKELRPGFKSPENVRGGFEVASIGGSRPAVSTLKMGSRTIDMPLPGVDELPAVLLIQCDVPGSNCAVGGIPLTTDAPISITLPGGFNFVIDEMLPSTPPSRARLEVAFSGPNAPAIKVGDRDLSIDERAAVVSAVAPGRVTLDLGVDRARDGWRYRGRRLRPGAPFLFETDRYEIQGTIMRVDVTEAR